MKGLLIKDFYLMKTTVRTYLALLVVFAVLSAVGVYGISMLNTVLMILLIMIPVNAFAYDEQAGWNKYAASTPMGRRGMVNGRYVYVLCIIFAGMVLAAALQVLLFFLGFGEGESLGSMIFSAAASVGAAGGLMNAILLPLIYKFGVQKSRLMLMIIMALTVGIVIGLTAGLDNITELEALGEHTVQLMGAGALLGLLSLVPSALISQSVCRKKDF